MKATHSGTIFGGLVDCYVLENGQRVVSQRGVVMALRGKKAGKNGGPRISQKGADFPRYLDRLPSKFSHLSSTPSIDFSLPSGGRGLGIEATQFVEILNAYVEAWQGGELHSRQVHLAQNAWNIIKALQKVGIVAMVDEATGYQNVRPKGALLDIFNRILVDGYADYEFVFGEQLVMRLCRIYGIPYESRQPRFLASVYSKMYRKWLGESLYEELKRRNPDPGWGMHHYQKLNDPFFKLLKSKLGELSTVAALSSGKASFWRNFDKVFKTAPDQLDLDMGDDL